MSLTNCMIEFKSTSVPSFKGETEIELTLSNDGINWHILRRLGFGYSKEPSELSFELNSEEVEAMIKDLSQVSISVLPEGLDGLGGTTYCLVITCGQNSVAHEWWEELPGGFKDLEVVIDKLFNFADLDFKEMYEY